MEEGSGYIHPSIKAEKPWQKLSILTLSKLWKLTKGVRTAGFVALKLGHSCSSMVPESNGSCPCLIMIPLQVRNRLCGLPAWDHLPQIYWKILTEVRLRNLHFYINTLRRFDCLSRSGEERCRLGPRPRLRGDAGCVVAEYRYRSILGLEADITPLCPCPHTHSSGFLELGDPPSPSQRP